MTVRTQPTLSPCISARVTEAMALSPSSFCKRYMSSYETPSSSDSLASSSTLTIWKRYRGTSELILDTKTEDDESEAEGAGSGSEESENKGLGLEVRGGFASLTIPSPVASPVTTPAATIAIDEDKFIEVGAQLELHRSIL
ncbi:hypothetical protein Tco_1233856 [Tanacetum coccineum]